MTSTHTIILPTALSPDRLNSSIGDIHNHTHHNPTNDWVLSPTVQPSILIPNANQIMATIKRSRSFSLQNNNNHINHSKRDHHYRFHNINSNIDDDTETYWKNQRNLGITLRHAFASLSMFGMAESKFARVPRLNALRKRARKCFFAIFFLTAAFRLIRREGILNIRVCDNRLVDETHNIHLPTGAGCVALPDILEDEFKNVAIKRLQVIFQPLLLHRILRKKLKAIYTQHYRDVPPPTVEDLKLSSTFFSLFPTASLQELISRGKMRVYQKTMWVGAPRSARSAARSIMNRSSDSKLSRLLPALSSSGVLPPITPALYSAFIVLHGIVTDLDGKDCSLGQCYGEACVLAEGGVTGEGFKVTSPMALTWEVDVNDIVQCIATLSPHYYYFQQQQQLQNNNFGNSSMNSSTSIMMMRRKSSCGGSMTIGNRSKRNSSSMNVGNFSNNTTNIFEEENENDDDEIGEQGELDDTNHNNNDENVLVQQDEKEGNNSNINRNGGDENTNNNKNNSIKKKSSSSSSPVPFASFTYTNYLNNKSKFDKCFEAIMNHVIELRIQIITQYFRPTISQIQNWELFRAASPVDVTTHILPRLVPRVYFANSTIVSPESSESERAVYLVARGRVLAKGSPNLELQQQQQQSSTNSSSSSSSASEKEFKTFGEYEGYFSEGFDLSFEASTIVDCWVLPRAVIQSIAKIPYLRPDMILRGLRLREQMLHRCGPSRSTIEFVLSQFLSGGTKRLHYRLVDTVLKVLQPKVFPAGERVITAGEDEKTCIFFIRGKLNQSSANGFIPHAPPALYGPQSILHSIFDPSVCVTMHSAVVASSWKLSLVAVRNVECWMVTVSRLHAALKIFFETCDIPKNQLIMLASEANNHFNSNSNNNNTNNNFFGIESSHHHQQQNHNNNQNIIGGGGGGVSSLKMFHSGSTFASPVRNRNNNGGNSVVSFIQHNNLNTNEILVNNNNNNNNNTNNNKKASISATTSTSAAASSPSYLRPTKSTANRLMNNNNDEENNNDKNNNNNEDNNNNNFMMTMNMKHEPHAPNSKRPSSSSLLLSSRNNINNNNKNTTTNSTTTSTNELLSRKSNINANSNHKIEMCPFTLLTDEIGKERVEAVRHFLKKERADALKGPKINEWLEMPFDDDDERGRSRARRMQDLECLQVHVQPPDKRFLLRMRKLPQTPRLHGKNLPEFGDVARKRKAEELVRQKENAANEQLNRKTSGNSSSSSATAATTKTFGSNFTVPGQEYNPNSARSRAKAAAFGMGIFHQQENNKQNNNNNNDGNSNPNMSSVTEYFENLRRNNQLPTTDLGAIAGLENNNTGTGGNNNNNTINNSSIISNSQSQSQSQQQQQQVPQPRTVRLLSSSGNSAQMISQQKGFSRFLEQEFDRLCQKHDEKLTGIDSAREYQMKLLKIAEARAEKFKKEPQDDRL